MPLIFLVEDDAGIVELLSAYLTLQGFEVSAAQHAQALDELLALRTPDCLILDVMLPGLDGLSILRNLRLKYVFPVLMLSALGDDIDRIVGLEVGADDYMAKPFNPRELVARLRALLRRNTESSATKPNLPRIGAWLFDADKLRLIQPNSSQTNQVCALTQGEADLLSLLLQSPNQVVSRDVLVSQLQGYERGPFDRAMDVRITRLRRKLETHPERPEHLRTVRGVGYRLDV